jgi:hypothetical protein
MRIWQALLIWLVITAAWVVPVVYVLAHFLQKYW